MSKRSFICNTTVKIDNPNSAIHALADGFAEMEREDVRVEMLLMSKQLFDIAKNDKNFDEKMFWGAKVYVTAVVDGGKFKLLGFKNDEMIMVEADCMIL